MASSQPVDVYKRQVMPVIPANKTRKRDHRKLAIAGSRNKQLRRCTDPLIKSLMNSGILWDPTFVIGKSYTEESEKDYKFREQQPKESELRFLIIKTFELFDDAMERLEDDEHDYEVNFETDVTQIICKYISIFKFKR